jgi:hypothetical protein
MDSKIQTNYKGFGTSTIENVFLVVEQTHAVIL